MAEHLHGYPRCETPTGTLCASSDLHWEECKSFGAMRSCEASVVDGIPTGQYRCTHDEAPAKAAPRPKGKARKAAKARPRAARKAAPKKKAKAKKGAKKARPAAKKKAPARRPAKKGARKKK